MLVILYNRNKWNPVCIDLCNYLATPSPEDIYTG